MQVDGLRETLDPSPESIGTCQGFFRHMCQFFHIFFLPKMQVECCMILQGSLGGNFDTLLPAVNPLLEYSSGKQDQLAWGFVLYPNSISLVTHLIRARGTFVVFWRENLGRQPQLIALENEGGDNTNFGLQQASRWSWRSLWSTTSTASGAPLNLISLQDRQVHRQDGHQLHHQQVVEGVETKYTSRERLYPHPRPSPLAPQLIPIPMGDGEDDQPPQGEGKDNGLDRVSEFFLTYQCRRIHKFNLFRYCRIRWWDVR